MSFLTLDLNLLRVFDAVMTEQNLTRAANLLAMTQPAVSNALRRLRDTLNDELVIRTAHGVKPTPRAEELWPTVRRALSELEAVITPETFDVARAQNTFRMAMVDATAAVWLPSLMRTIMRDAADHARPARHAVAWRCGSGSRFFPRRHRATGRWPGHGQDPDQP